jgi:hypothetical protein
MTPNQSRQRVDETEFASAIKVSAAAGFSQAARIKQ